MSTTTNVTNVAGGASRTQPRGPVIAAWVTTGIFAAMMTVSGVLYVTGNPKVVVGMVELGYPIYFIKLLGVAKLFGVVGLLAPGRRMLREWAYAGFTFDLVGAVVSHLATGGGSHVPAPVVVLAILTASYISRKRITRNA